MHTVLEATDFAAPTSTRSSPTQIASAPARAGRSTSVSRIGSSHGLRAAIETPLGPLVDGVRLRDVARARPARRARVRAAPGRRRRAHRPAHAAGDRRGAREPICRPPIRWPPTPRGSRTRRCARTVRGFLTGSIDLVMRLPGPRFAIVDYKTNWLGPAGEPLTLAHYQPEALAAEMSRAHYGLQALLYTVALHRYLRWRLPGYEPGPPPRRRALPVRARHGRRAGRRRVRVAPAGRARARR